MNVTQVVDRDRTGKADHERHLSFLARHTSHLGWLTFALGALWDVAYHAPTLMFAVRWPPAIDSVGEFGHVITFAGAIIIIYGILRNHERRGL